MEGIHSVLTYMAGSRDSALKCIAAGKPAPSVTWYKNNNRLIDDPDQVNIVIFKGN